jgi:putative ABC transport system permease protein
MRTGLAALWSRVRGWLRSSAEDAEFDEELNSHFEMLVDEHVARGLSRDAAVRAARVKLGGVTQLKEVRRELNGLPLLESFTQDVRYAFRTFSRSPGFAAVAVLTLGLGIGANTAVFSVVHAVLLEPLPYRHPDQLLNVSQARPADGIQGTGWSYANFSDLREQNHVFSELAGAQNHQLTLTGWGDPLAVDTSVVTPELFAMFGVRPLMGRAMTSADGAAGAAAVVVLSEGLWRARFGADPGVIGRSIDLDKRSFTVIGVMPAAFRFPLLSQNEQIWIPLRQDPLFGPWMQRRGGHWLQVTGRLKDGVSEAQLDAALEAYASRASQDFPAENAGWTVRARPLQQMIVGGVRQALIVLLAAVGVVLLIACVNIANLLLTRATSRGRELALRSSLGAGQGRIFRQLLTEAGVLGAAGGVVGVAIAIAGVRGLSSMIPASIPRVNTIAVDAVVLGFALALSVSATLICGLAPSLFAAKIDLQKMLKEDGRSGESAVRRRTRSVLAAAEIALALVLLTAAGLVLRSFANLTSVDPGFDPSHVLKAEVSLPRFAYSTPQQWRTFVDALLARVHGEPGLANAAVAIPAPIADGFVNLTYEVVGEPVSPATAAHNASYVAISPEYFRVMQVPLLAGRTFDGHDTPESRNVCIISATMARRHFGDRSPIGRRLKFGFPPDGDAVREIVGVVGDMRDVALDHEPGPMMYVPFAQAPFPGAVLLIRTSVAAAAVVPIIRREVAAIDPDLPVTDVGMMPDLIGASVAQPRFRTVLLGLFAAIALALAAIGVFGVISYSVSRRSHEIGVRMALGASKGTILAMVLRETAGVTIAGFIAGVPSALFASRFIRHLLFAVSDRDPWTLAAVAAMLGAAATLAGFIPARRATHVLPIVALRHD